MIATPALVLAQTDSRTADVTLPSGRALVLHEVLTDTAPGELWVRFRFVAEGFSQADIDDHDRAAADMDWVCENLAVPYLEHHQLRPARVAISFADRPLPFGEIVPDAVQVFETYRVENGACIWEEF